MIRDWGLLKHQNNTYLVHSRCLGRVIDDCPSCAAKILNSWVCQFCGEVAPEEIEFVADLNGHVYDYSECLAVPSDTYTPDLYDHNGEWLNSNSDITVHSAAPIIATPEQYLYEKIAEEQGIKDIEEWDAAMKIKLWRDADVEFQTTTPVYPLPSNNYSTNLARNLARVK